MDHVIHKRNVSYPEALRLGNIGLHLTFYNHFFFNFSFILTTLKEKQTRYILNHVLTDESNNNDSKILSYARIIY